MTIHKIPIIQGWRETKVVFKYIIDFKLFEIGQSWRETKVVFKSPLL